MQVERLRQLPMIFTADYVYRKLGDVSNDWMVALVIAVLSVYFSMSIFMSIRPTVVLLCA